MNVCGEDTACLEVSVHWETRNVDVRESTYI